MTAIFEETRDVNRRLNSDILSGRRAARLGLPSARGQRSPIQSGLSALLRPSVGDILANAHPAPSASEAAHPVATQPGRHSALRQYGSGAKGALLNPDQACASRGISGCLGRSDSVAAYWDGDEAVSLAVLVHGAGVDGEAVRLLGEPRPHLGQGDGRCGGLLRATAA